MICNDAGLLIIKSFEGCKLVSYQDQDKIWTIGFGHTGKDVFPDQSISQYVADQLLAQDVAVAGNAISRLVKVALTENQFSALCSFVFNIGQGNFGASTLLAILNRGGYDQVATQMLRWDNVAGQPNPGLLRRRVAEKNLWETTPSPAGNDNAPSAA